MGRFNTTRVKSGASISIGTTIRVRSRENGTLRSVKRRGRRWRRRLCAILLHDRSDSPSPSTSGVWNSQYPGTGSERSWVPCPVNRGSNGRNKCTAIDPIVYRPTNNLVRGAEEQRTTIHTCTLALGRSRLPLRKFTRTCSNREI